MKALLSGAIVALVTNAAACGGGGGKYGDHCSSAGDCQSSMTCPTVGPMAGRCTKSCTKDEECAAIGGGVCTSDVCVPTH
jgi:hypothetical protein